MRVVNGIHVGNTRQWHVEQMLTVDKGRGAVTILHHLMFPRDTVADQWGDVENAYWYWKLRHGWEAQGIPAAPERLIHVRLYHPEWRRLDPTAWAQHAAGLLADWRFNDLRANLWDDPMVCISPANEQDIEGYGPGGAASTVAEYEAIGRWNLAFWDEIDRLLPRRRALSCWSALAGGHDAMQDDPDSEYGVAAIREAIERCDIGAVHLYGHMEWGADGDKTLPGGADAYWHMLRAWRPAGWRDQNQPTARVRPRDRGGFRAQFPGKPMLITEAGTFAHHDAARTKQTVSAMSGLLRAAKDDGKCLGVTWFIWSTDDAHPTNNIMPNAKLREALAAAPAYETSAMVPPRRVAAPTPPKEEPMDDLAKLLAAEFGGAFSDIRARMPVHPNPPYGPFGTRALSLIDAYAVHHTAGARTTTWETVARQHIGQGWYGIGYHIGIQGGVVSYLGDIGTARANVENQNHRVVGVVLAGNFAQHGLAPEDHDALRRVVMVLDRFLDRQPDIKPHSAFKATACPGDPVRAVLATLRADAPPSDGGLDALLRSAAAASQKIRLNPTAGLQRAIQAAGYWPTGNEFESIHGGKRYVAQRAEHPGGHGVRVYYVIDPDWSNVRYISG